MKILKVEKKPVDKIDKLFNFSLKSRKEINLIIKKKKFLQRKKEEKR